MTSRFTTAAGRLANRITDRVGESATYSDGTNEAPVTATFVRREYETISPEGLVTIDHTWLAFIKSAEIVLADTETKPARGHTIERTVGNETQLFAVQHPAGGDVYEPVDPQEVLLRIFVQLITRT